MDLEIIIENLLKPDTALIRQASNELEEAFKYPGTIEQLCRIMACHNRDEIRQYAALLLTKRLGKRCAYMEASANIQNQIKTIMLDVLLNEKCDSVRCTMTRFFGCVLRHEGKRDNAWVNEILQKLVNHCKSPCQHNVEIGMFILGNLADVASKPIVQNFDVVSGLFNIVLTAAEENSTDISFKAIYNILSAMASLIPETSGFPEVEKAYQAEIPHFVSIINKFAMSGRKDHYEITFEILENIIFHVPILVYPHIRLLLEIPLALGLNATYNSDMRIQALYFINIFIKVKRKYIIELNLMDPIIKTSFEIIASEPESGDTYEFFVSFEKETPLSAANTVIDTLATNMPPEKFFPQILNLIEPAFYNLTDNQRRRAAFTVLGTIAEGCRDIISNHYLKSLLSILKSALNDTEISVRNAVLFALDQFSELLQPEIMEYAHDVMPLLLQHAEEIIQAYQLNKHVGKKTVEREFDALEAFCKGMENDLAPFMENLMSIVLNLLDNTYPKYLQITAVRLADCIGNAYQGSLLPWFPDLLKKLCPLLLQEEKTDSEELRPQAINTLASIVRNVGQHFLPFAEETMLNSLQWIEANDDPDLRQSILNLFGAISSVLGENFNKELPLVLKHIDRCLNDVPVTAELTNFSVCKSSDVCRMGEGDEMCSDCLSDEVVDDEFCCVNASVQAKEQAVLTIKELAEECPQALSPYLQGLLEILLNNMMYPYVEIRKNCISVAFLLASELFAKQIPDGGRNTFDTLLNKYLCIVYNDANSEVVTEALEYMGEVLLKLGSEALPSKELLDSIVLCINDGLTSKFLCQIDEETIFENSETSDNNLSDTAVIKGAARLLRVLGKIVCSDEFLHYFKKISPLLLKHIDKDNGNESQCTRVFLIGILAKCYGPLDKNISSFFIEQLNIMICATKDRNAQIRQNAILGLGELVRAGKEMSYIYYPVILQNLAQLSLTAQDHCVIGALARLVLVNANLVPLEQVVPIMVEKIIMLDDEKELRIVFSCFENLFRTMSAFMQCYIKKIVAAAKQTIEVKNCGQTLTDAVSSLLETVHEVYPNFKI